MFLYFDALNLEFFQICLVTSQSLRLEILKSVCCCVEGEVAS